MNRYILFDSHCQKCTRLAREIEDEVGTKLEARSLHDSSIQALLDQVQPDWSWEPMLLEVDQDSTRLHTGFAMRIRLLRILGVSRSLRVLQLLSGDEHQSPANPERRDFLR